MIIKKLSVAIANHVVKEAPEHEDRVESIRYAIAYYLNVVPTIALIVTIGLITDELPNMIIALTTFAIMRQFTGGYHLKSTEMCIVITVIVVTAISFSDYPKLIINILTLASVLLIILFAPSRLEGKTRFPKKYFNHLRITAILLAATNFIILSPIISSALLLQSLTLIRRLEKGGEAG